MDFALILSSCSILCTTTDCASMASSELRRGTVVKTRRESLFQRGTMFTEEDKARSRKQRNKKYFLRCITQQQHQQMQYNSWGS